MPPDKGVLIAHPEWTPKVEYVCFWFIWLNNLLFVANSNTSLIQNSLPDFLNSFPEIKKNFPDSSNSFPKI